MRIDVNYLKTVLDKFVDNEKEYLNTEVLQSLIDEDLEKFSFHWDILKDKQCIVLKNGNPPNIIQRSSNHTTTIIKHNYVRLSDDGYNFYESIKDNEFRNKIKKDFKDISIETLWLVAKRFLDNKIDNFLG